MFLEARRLNELRQRADRVSSERPRRLPLERIAMTTSEFIRTLHVVS